MKTRIAKTKKILVRFNQLGEITEMETTRNIEENKHETWVCRMNNYQLINNIRIPIECEAIWRLQSGDVSYAQFRVIRIEYDQPLPF